MQRALVSLWMVVVLATLVWAVETKRVLDSQFMHLRVGGPREWSEFPKSPAAAELEVRFRSRQNEEEWTLRLRQQDVKQTWDVLLNEKPLGQLVRDENDMVVYFSVPARALISGENHLRIRQRSQRPMAPDDIRVGQIQLASWPLSDALHESTLEINVIDGDFDRPVPARITITDANGTLQTSGATSNDHLAVRPGIVYTSTGSARIDLPSGKYVVYVGRGIEYSLDSAEVTLAAGERLQQVFSIRRDVPTDGYVACDTHVHTLTHSGHGDATVEERMITLAAEGIELPIATDHNVHINHEPFARKMNVRQFFTPVIGNEVTTNLGHFNVFPVQIGARVPNHELEDWNSILNDIYRTPSVKVAILNHARDLHGGVRPFGPRRFNDVVGENLDGWAMRFNAMEVINSSATQTDPMRLFHDWMALMNRGYDVTPIGSSDSHDVGRHFVGQGRTYIRCDDRDPSRIDVDQAVHHLIQGKVMVSYGLLTDIKVDSKHTAGELASVTNDRVNVAVRVLGPHWVKADQVRLYSNGQQVRVTEIANETIYDLPSGTKWQNVWTLPRPSHDVHLVAIATGPGIEQPYWKTAKPYQPRSSDWEARVIGCSGAVWIDGDGDGRKSSAYDYARRVFSESGDDLQRMTEILADYDQAVAAQAAHLYQTSGRSLLSAASQDVIAGASDNVKTGFRIYSEAWHKNSDARE